MQLHQAEPLSGDAAAAEEQGLSPREQRRAIEHQLQQLRGAIDAVLDSRAGDAGGASGSGGAGGSGPAELADAPEEFLDPILMTLMQVAVLAGGQALCVVGVMCDACCAQSVGWGHLALTCRLSSCCMPAMLCRPCNTGSGHPA